MKHYLYSLIVGLGTYLSVALGSVLTDLQNSGPQSMYGSRDNPMVDPATATIPAGVWTPAYPITHTDTGTAAMTGITVPYATFSGRITVIPGGAFTWTNATNIAVAGTAVVSRALDFVYSPKTGKWYPSYV